MALEDFARQLGRCKFLSWSHGHHAFRVVGELVHAKPSARRRVPDAYALIEGKWLRLRLPAVHYQCASDGNRGRNARRQECSLVHFSLLLWLSDSHPSKQSGGPQGSSGHGSTGGPHRLANYLQFILTRKDSATAHGHRHLRDRFERRGGRGTPTSSWTLSVIGTIPLFGGSSLYVRHRRTPSRHRLNSNKGTKTLTGIGPLAYTDSEHPAGQLFASDRAHQFVG